MFYIGWVGTAIINLDALFFANSVCSSTEWVIVKKIQLTLILTIIGSLWFYPGWGVDSSSVNDNRGHDWYSSQAPVDVDKLTDENLVPAQDQKNNLWIIESTGMNVNTSLDIPAGNWARLKLVPSASGELKIYCQYPTGSNVLLLTDNVQRVAATGRGTRLSSKEITMYGTP